MEDVLAVYTRPRDPDYPLVCLDETSKQFLAETRLPIPMKRGRRLRNVSRRIAGRIERNAPPPQLESSPALPAARHPEGRPANPNSEYARQAAPHDLDPYNAAPPVCDHSLSAPGRSLW